ncbi:hypothetical protein CF327_g7337 [Tilletia walkeri]|nr:hypothetical protein CF327_g7337 [Tilletia walkeri]
MVSSSMSASHHQPPPASSLPTIPPRHLLNSTVPINTDPAVLISRIFLDALLPLLCAILAIRSFIPPHRASTKAQSRCRKDAFASFGLIKVPPVLVTTLYTLALIWHVRVGWGDVLSTFGAEAWALPALVGQEAWWERLGWTMAGLGGGLRYWCYRELWHFFTFTLAVLDDHRIVSSGPYSIVRHPSYSGLFMVTSGLTVLMQVLPIPYVGNCPPFRAACVTIFCAYMIWSRIEDEEEMMVREFETRRRRQKVAAGTHSRQSSSASGSSSLLTPSFIAGDATHLHSVTVDKKYGSVQIQTEANGQAGISVKVDQNSHEDDVETDYEAYRRKVPWKLIPYLV